MMLRPKLGLGLGASEGRDLRAVREGRWRDWLRESLGERGQEKEAAKEGSGRNRSWDRKHLVSDMVSVECFKGVWWTQGWGWDTLGGQLGVAGSQ